MLTCYDVFCLHSDAGFMSAFWSDTCCASGLIHAMLHSITLSAVSCHRAVIHIALCVTSTVARASMV